MTAAPNTSPSFIQTVGIVGQPVQLTNQVCTRDAPGTAPIVIYDPTANYALGNGAFVEEIRIEATGVSVASCLMLFHRVLTEAIPVWRKSSEVALPAVASVSNDSAIAGYPVFMPLPKILGPVPQTGNTSQFTGLRINYPDSSIQWGVALTVAVGGSPINVVMYGGEL